MRYQGGQVDRLLIKVGSGVLYDGNAGTPAYRESQMEALVDEIAWLSDRMHVALVSSGAIATARSEYGHPKPDLGDVIGASALAGAGQGLLMERYRHAFAKHGKVPSQRLLTHPDLTRQYRSNYVRSVIEADFDAGRIPIVNENDTVTAAGVRGFGARGFGDNDILAAYMACCIHARLMVMLSSPSEGVGTGGGSSKHRARRILNHARPHIPLEILSGDYEYRNETWQPKIRELFSD
jgi:glutamate 5-kinase